MLSSKRRKNFLVFLSHANEDKPAVVELFKRLRNDGFDVWLDEERILPGQEWSLEIEQAMGRSDVILLCFSEKSVSKEGYIQREYKKATKFQEEKPEGTIFVIPVRFDDCEIPFSLKNLQWVNFPSGYEKLVKSLNIRAEKVVSSEDSAQTQDNEIADNNANLDIENNFLQRVFAESRFVALGGIDSKISDPGQKSVELKSIYVDLLTTEVAVDSAQVTYLKEPVPVSALNALNQHNRLVILGGPGSGKSTFVKFITLCLSGDRLDERQGDTWINELKSDDATWSHGSLIPIRIALGELPIDEILMEKNTAGNQNDLISQVLAFVLEAMNSKDFLKLLNDYLQNGKLIFFFDGLDEVVDKNMRQIVAESISDFVKKYSQCRYVVTCRTATYPHTELEAVHKPWMLRDFHVITLGTWDEKRISQFIEFWFRELSNIGRFNKNIGKNKAENLDNALKTRPEMRGIAASPLLLTVMAIVHDHYGELPDTRVALYQKCTDLLLWRWEAVKHGSRVITEAQNPDILNSLKLQRFVKPRDIEQVLYQIVYKAHSLVKDNTQDGDNASARIGVNELKNELAQLFKAVDIAPKEAYEKATEFVDYYIRERVGLFEEKYDDASGAIYFVAIHRSFQEYLAARHLCSQRDFSPLAVSLVIKSFDQWREVFLMAVEQMVHENYGFQAIDAVNRLYEEDNTSSVKSIDIYILVGDSVAAIGKPALNKDPIGKKLIKSMSGTFYGLCKDSQLAITKRSQIGSLLGEIGDPRFEPVVDAEHEQAVIFPSLIRIPEGIFMMGDEKLFEVKLPEYQIAKYPVTEGEYELFIRANGNYRCPDHWRHNRPPEGKTNHPVTNVSWEDANQYCKWLTVMAHNERFIPLEKVVRLPTEAEWEKAMRWDEQESASRLYPWGNQWVGNLCNSIETGLGSTSSVGIFEEGNSPYDLCDGVGNVFEWCNSLEKEYPYKIDDGREMQTVSGFRVVRGGSWNTTELFANCIKRGWLPQTSKTSNFGFRVVVADKIG